MNIRLLLILLLFSGRALCQGSYPITDPQRPYKEAQEYFLAGDYCNAYPLIQKLVQKEGYAAQPELQYYWLVCRLVLNQPAAEEEANRFIQGSSNEGMKQVMHYHLARYYFNRQDYGNAITHYQAAGYQNLNNDQIATAKFELAYAYFNEKQFEKAKPLFNEIHQVSSNRYYLPANYYYGFISYKDKQYAQALQSFQVVEHEEEYRLLVPYYIAQIYYFEGKRDEALKYGLKALNQKDLYYRNDLSLLIGQIYFDQKQFALARPLLEAYVTNRPKVSREVMYELSYAYFDADSTAKAIAGFKQLSGSGDSLAQNAMYLLGDLYLKTGDKTNARNAFQYAANNSSNRTQQEVAMFNYAKLSYELGYQDVALSSMKDFLNRYPKSAYAAEGKEIMVGLLANTSNYNEALALYQSFDKATPAMQKVYPAILLGKATALINDQRLPEADELLAKVVTNPNAGKALPVAQFWRGEIAYRQGRYDDAIQNLNSYMTSGITQGEANPKMAKYDLGYSYLKKEKYQQAYTYFEQVAGAVTVSSPATEQDAYVRQGDAAYMLKDYTKAKTIYDNVINKSFAQSDYALYQKAMIAGIKSSADKIRLLTTLINQYSSSDLVGDAYLEIANTYMSTEKFKEAIPNLNSIISGTWIGLKPKAYLKLGLAHYNLDNNSEALSDYQKLLTQYPQSPEADEALENMKAIYVEEGKPNEYVEVLKRAGKSIRTTEADSLTYNAAFRKYSNADCVSAITGFTNYLSQFPAGYFAVPANYYVSECYSKNKDWQNAVKGYEMVANTGGSKYAEIATLQAARINYLELHDYGKSKTFFNKLKDVATTQENRLEALRGLVRSYYQTKDYTEANNIAKELAAKKGLSSDDKAIANLVLGKSYQVNNQCEQAITAFKAVAAINKSAWGAEARYEAANCYLTLNNLPAAEKGALEVIKQTASYDYWVAKAYILLGDVYMQQKDYFNAKASYQGVANNATIVELKSEAQQKLDKAIADEKANSKVGQ